MSLCSVYQGLRAGACYYISLQHAQAHCGILECVMASYWSIFPHSSTSDQWEAGYQARSQVGIDFPVYLSLKWFCCSTAIFWPSSFITYFNFYSLFWHHIIIRRWSTSPTNIKLLLRLDPQLQARVESVQIDRKWVKKSMMHGVQWWCIVLNSQLNTMLGNVMYHSLTLTITLT